MNLKTVYFVCDCADCRPQLANLRISKLALTVKLHLEAHNREGLNGWYMKNWSIFMFMTLALHFFRTTNYLGLVAVNNPESILKKTTVNTNSSHMIQSSHLVLKRSMYHLK